MRKLAIFALLAVSCTTSRATAPEVSSPLPQYSFSALKSTPVTVRVLDHRADPQESSQWTSRVKTDVERSLRAAGVTVGDGEVLEIRIHNLRADFELGNWNGCAKLNAAIGHDSATAERCVKKGNLWGYKTADNVMNMAYRDALAELLSRLDARLR
ncbi:MAG TPA: hypothetical protein VM733_09625 [Thermoanaerobaculia bacterium]|nr:hypothetical protein [Thermoanaerobaculia bacterium]